MRWLALNVYSCVIASVRRGIRAVPHLCCRASIQYVVLFVLLANKECERTQHEHAQTYIRYNASASAHSLKNEEQ